MGLCDINKQTHLVVSRDYQVRALAPYPARDLARYWGLTRQPRPQHFHPGVLALPTDDLTDLYEPTGRTFTLSATLRGITQPTPFTRYASSQHIPGPIVLREAWWDAAVSDVTAPIEIQFGDWLTVAPEVNEFPEVRPTGHTARGINHYSTIAAWGITIKHTVSAPEGVPGHCRAHAIVELLRPRARTP